MATKPPAGLQKAGQKLWDLITDEHALAVWELEVLEGACRTKDLIGTLDADIAIAELKTTGSTGQEVLNDSIRERRMQETHLVKLLTTLRLPDAAALAGGATKARAASSNHARQAARARWAETPT